MAKITPVLMSGGAGTRLWPLSRQGRPKQFHALGTPRTLIQETALRTVGPAFEAPVVVCAAPHAGLVRYQLAEAGVEPQLVLTEPAPRNTAPCAVAAAAVLAARDPDALMLLAPSDHVIADVAAFAAAIEAGRPAAEAGAIVVFGLKPDRPETGYGYIRAGEANGALRRVAAFVEKPDLATAEAFVADGAYSWNAGIFLAAARTILAEARRLAPEVAAAAEAAAKAPVHEGVLHLGPEFLAAPSISIDYAVMEKTDLALVVPCDPGWSDVGAWQALWEAADRDAAGNALVGAALAPGGERNLVMTDGPTVVVSGLSDLVVVVQDGVVLVAPRERSEAVRDAVAAVKAAGKGELL